jgi:RNA ligase
MYAKHTVFYDALPHYFLEFDIWDRELGVFLSTERRHEMLAGGPVMSVPVLQMGQFASLKEITKLVRPSLYKSEQWHEKIEIKGSETDGSDFSEGLYLKWEEDGIVKDRYKWVRPDFVQAILDSKTHWMARQIVPNLLAEGVNLW